MLALFQINPLWFALFLVTGLGVIVAYHFSERFRARKMGRKIAEKIIADVEYYIRELTPAQIEHVKEEASKAGNPIHFELPYLAVAYHYPREMVAGGGEPLTHFNAAKVLKTGYKFQPFHSCPYKGKPEEFVRYLVRVHVGITFVSYNNISVWVCSSRHATPFHLLVADAIAGTISREMHWTVVPSRNN